jgi:hypothetical protein
MADTLSDIAELSQKILGRCLACLNGHHLAWVAMILPEMGIA